MTARWDRFRQVAGVPDLETLGPELCVPFPVRSLPHADIAWLNERWWIERGWNVDAPASRRTVTQWLLRNFAVLACEPIEATAVLSADRYGGSYGTRHGGSGRCGIAGAFNAKGIGRTPLCPAEVRGSHGDGRLSMAEALREAIAGEIAADELPWGGVPVVAIIMTNSAPAVAGEAILVRPNFVRPAHFERSIFFGTAGFPGSDQECDARRTRAAIQTASHHPDKIGFPGLVAMMERLGEQLGAARAHRLWQGKFLSSNVSVDAALVDFGSFRSVPSWRRFFGEPEEEFGGEERYIASAARSLAAGFAKYAPPTPAGAVQLTASALRGLERGFDTAVAAALGLSETIGDGVISVLRGYFARQQRERVQVGDRPNWALPWLHDLLLRPDLAADRAFAAEAQVVAALAPLLDDSMSALRPALVRWTCPRHSFHYERTAPALERVGDAIRRAPERAGVLAKGTIDAYLSRVQRHWAGLPREAIVHGQVRQGGMTALYATLGVDGPTKILLRDARIADGQQRVEGIVPENSTRTWIQIDGAANELRRGVSAIIDGVRVTVPPPRFTYPSSLP